jgi:hypothetical protein
MRKGPSVIDLEVGRFVSLGVADLLRPERRLGSSLADLASD